MRERAAETKNRERRKVEESLSMHTWKEMMQLEVTEALFDSVFRSGAFIHNY